MTAIKMTVLLFVHQPLELQGPQIAQRHGKVLLFVVVDIVLVGINALL
jgi:hypothetical protein